eukprot:TRINITY_DN12863_c0_g1_i3.p1 TRINITY_DN12863_c0_g1~~TRINITY_DN12863_c0_g1_i3.p1  ORF type:complete len:109 (+),score=13.03 TRINITY_DN12863_c0_g1_i3:32-328(+)
MATEWLRDHAASYRVATSSSAHTSPAESAGGFVRVWCYLPSLSSREKRLDLITYAQHYKLTGFITPGKPGIVCVEGAESNVNSYFNDIRSRCRSLIFL